MQSRGFFPARRPTDERIRVNSTVHRSNGDVIRNDYRLPTLPSRLENRHEAREEPCHRYGRAERDRNRSAYLKNHVYPTERTTDRSYVDPDTEMQPRRVRRRDYEERSSWRDGLADLSGSKPILRNGISHGRGERLYSSTLPRRGRTINFRDQGGTNLESRRTYPRSMQDLSDLEPDDRAFLSSSSRLWKDDGLDEVYRRRRCRQDQLENDYLNLYRSLSRLDKYPHGGRYEPGQVHYERECRTFGKDTVAFIYYKTCYL